jgi:hypothetical protein
VYERTTAYRRRRVWRSLEELGGRAFELSGEVAAKTGCGGASFMGFLALRPPALLLAGGTRLYCRTAVRLEWPKMEGRFCVYVVDVWIFINIVVSCGLPTIEIES